MLLKLGKTITYPTLTDNHIILTVYIHLYSPYKWQQLSAQQVIAAELNRLECGPMPNVMAALPNTGGALCSTPQSLADAD